MDTKKTTRTFNFDELNESAKNNAIRHYLKSLMIGVPYNIGTSNFKKALEKAKQEMRSNELFNIYWKEFRGDKEAVKKLNNLKFSRDGRVQSIERLG